jgi:uncharacterized protein (TIGR03118 family)
MKKFPPTFRTGAYGWQRGTLATARALKNKKLKLNRIMKKTIVQKTITSTCATAVRSSLLLSASLALATCIPSVAKADPKDAETNYRQINLVSDISGIAQVQDTNLVNAWGISFHPTFPFWVSDNGTGVTTLYSVTNDASGIPHASATPSVAIGIAGTGPAVVSIPGAGNVTGQVANNSAEFNGDIFLFVSEDGTISGWRPGIGPAAETLATRTNAIYKGVTLATVGTNTVLLAANFHEGTLDVYDGNSQLLGQFTDQRAPAGYAPFNVQNLNGVIFVTFAKQDAAKRDDVAGRGRGLIDTFDISTGNFHRFAAGKAAGGNVREMNSPWGLAIAPPSFGSHANQLLVGNFGSGTIMTFDARGKFKGLLQGTGDCPVTIDGLWGLTFGADGGVSGVSTDLYFSAGPNNESHGLFGAIQVLNDSEEN